MDFLRLPLLAIWLACTTCVLPRPATPDLLAGPMLGDLTPHSLRIWAQSNIPTKLRVEIAESAMGWPWKAARDAQGEEALLDLNDQYPRGQVQIVGLRAKTTYRYRLLCGDTVIATGPTLFFHTPAEGPEGFSFRVAFGSCANDEGSDPEQGIFQQILQAQPDLFLWLGDSVYYQSSAEEWKSTQAMERRWSVQRAKPKLQALLASVPQYAIWDDHDFGPNNGDSSYSLRSESKRIFQSYWANPQAAGEGIYYSFRWGRVEFFMLDTRYGRSPLTGVQKNLLSAAQWQWLEQALLASTADFKVLVSGMQVLADYHKFESWSQYPEERQRLLSFLEQHQLGGILFFSGDRHFAEVIRCEEEVPYPLYDFTSSPLAAGLGTALADSQVPQRVPGTLAVTENFGLMEFHYHNEEPFLSFQFYDAYGQALGKELVLGLEDLQP